ncbi:MAG: hypothetical protein F4213_18625 [Boseongicola sp. SB0677_bin_26]|nr:hypothetical protein [Boseongicola sp. SB0677_bin_26]
MSRTVPDDLSGLPDTNELELVGSSVSASRSVVAYKSSLVISEAMDAASAMLREAGWNDFAVGGPPSGGFVTNAQPRFDMFCREDSMVNVVGSAVDDTSYIRLMVTPNERGIPCDAVAGNAGSMMARAASQANMYELMPTLTLPGGVAPLSLRSALAASAPAFSGTERSARTEIELETDLSAQELVELFGRQLIEQGWVLDSGWAGEFSSGSSWTRSTAAADELVGLLDAVALGNAGHRASFRIVLATSAE